jgi:hypothetical protein
MTKKDTRTLSTHCYLKLKPVYNRHGQLEGVKAQALSQRAPRNGHFLRLKISVPARALTAFEAEIQVPAPAVQCKVIPIKEER